MVKTSSINCNVARLIQLIETKKLNLDHPIQRGYVWNLMMKSDLIHSILMDYDINTIYFHEIDGTYYAIDGKQRSDAVYCFVNNEYKLYAKTDPVITDSDETVSVANHFFEELSDEFKQKILGYGLMVRTIGNVTSEELVRFFKKINAGRQITRAELARLNVKSREFFLRLCDHQLFEEALTQKQKNKCTAEDILEDAWVISYNPNPSLLDSFRTPLLANIDVPYDQQRELESALDYMLALFKVISKDRKRVVKMRAKTHMTSLIYAAIHAIRNGITVEIFINKMIEFFSGEGRIATISDSYNIGAREGANKAEKVRIRQKEIIKALGLVFEDSEEPEELENMSAAIP